MKIKSIFLVLCIFILVFSMASVFSANVNVAGIDFEVPQGYSINKTSDISVKLVRNNNTNYTIFISENNFTDFNTSINSREVSGFNFLAEENYLSDNGIQINQQNYVKNESYYSFYSFEVNGTGYQIGYSLPSYDEFSEGEVNPVTGIINSI